MIGNLRMMLEEKKMKNLTGEKQDEKSTKSVGKKKNEETMKEEKKI